MRDDLDVAGLDDLRVGRPDLEATLAGLTHGGPVVLPGVGALYTSSQYDRFLAGWVDGPARGCVSRGLGISSLPVRINCPAELTFLDLAPVA